MVNPEAHPQTPLLQAMFDIAVHEVAVQPVDPRALPTGTGMQTFF